MSSIKRAALAVCVVLVALVWGCEDKVEPARIQGNSGAIPAQESWNTEVMLSDSGRMRATIRAGHVAIYDATHTTVLDSNVQVDFYSFAGLHSSVLTASSATIDDQTKDMVARGNVVVVSDSGTTVTTELLKWDNKRRKVHSDQFVRVVSPHEILQGYGFEADQDLKNYVIYRISGQKR